MSTKMKINLGHLLLGDCIPGTGKNSSESGVVIPSISSDLFTAPSIAFSVECVY